MRNVKVLFTDLIKKPPVLFPLVGLFHILWLFWLIWDDRFLHFPGIEWLQVLWMAAFATCWVAACDLRKWGAIGYILLTLLNASLYLAIKNENYRDLYMSPLFLIGGLFSFFLVFYYKKFG